MTKISNSVSDQPINALLYQKQYTIAHKDSAFEIAFYRATHFRKHGTFRVDVYNVFLTISSLIVGLFRLTIRTLPWNL